MTLNDLQPLAPIIILVITALFLLLFIAWGRSHAGALAVTIVGLTASLAESSWLMQYEFGQSNILMRVDSFSYFYILMFCSVGFIVALLAYDYFKETFRHPEEFYVLILLATIGCSVLVCAIHWASLFLGLEILSVSLYAMIGYTAGRERSLEAAIKYLILAGASSAFLAFGIALVYAQMGTMDFGAMGDLYVAGPSFVAIIGFGMILVAAGFKLAVVPFHFWTPDVYEGSPAPATAFVATASKGAMIGVLLRVFYEMNLPVGGGVYFSLAAIAIASMLIGNLLALMQNNVKRVLAYSSISHLGYIIVAFLATETMAAPAASYYVLAYMATMLGAFGVLSVLSNSDGDAEDISDYRVMAWRRPGLAAVMTFMLLSLAGIPLTAGFIGKFYLVAAGAQSSLWILLLVLALSSVIGLFYYLRIILVMFAGGAEAGGQGIHAQPIKMGERVSAGAGMILGVLFALVLWLGVHPGPVFLVLQELMRNPY